MTSLSDPELMLLAHEGDASAFEEIYDRYFDDLYEYGFRLCQNDFLVKDKIQDVFVKIWTRKTNNTTITNIKAYLFGALKNKLNEEFRNNSVRSLILDRIKTRADSSFSLEFELLKEEDSRIRLDRLHQALNQLSDRQKEIIYLRYLQDISYEEIARIMQITVKASYKLSARALENLKNTLSVNNKELMMLLLLLNHGVFHHQK